MKIEEISPSHLDSGGNFLQPLVAGIENISFTGRVRFQQTLSLEVTNHASKKLNKG